MALTKAEWQNLGYIPVPYHRIQKALAYAGKPFGTLKTVLGRLSLEYPEDDTEFRRLHLTLMGHARKISKNYQFTPQQCIDLEIDTFYQYLMAGGRRGVSPKADFVCRILIDCRDLRLRRMVDTLLYVGELDPAAIREAVYSNPMAPSTIWGEEEIGFYRDYIWDAAVMTTADWAEYHSWYESPQLYYIINFQPSSTRGDLLTAADLSIGIGDTAMLSRSRDMMYEMMQKAARRKDVRIFAQLSDSMNKNISLAARDLGDSTDRKKIKVALERITVPLDGSIGKEPIKSRDDLPEGSVIGDRGSTEQLDEVLRGDYDVETSEGTAGVDNVIPT